MLMKAQGVPFPEDKKPELYIVPMGDAAGVAAVGYCEQLRREGFAALTDLNGRGLKAQMKYANKLNVGYTLVLGDDELSAGKANVKNMATGEQTQVSLANLVDEFYNIVMDSAFDAMEESVNELGK